MDTVSGHQGNHVCTTGYTRFRFDLDSDCCLTSSKNALQAQEGQMSSIQTVRRLQHITNTTNTTTTNLPTAAATGVGARNKQRSAN